jgi:hypothetical protein
MILSINGMKDPFSILGIPTLNPSQIFNDDLAIRSKPNELSTETNLYVDLKSKKFEPLNSLEDLPKFLQNNKLNAEEGTKIISKFLISDDYMLKKYGAVFDQTGFDGIMNIESINPIGRPERIVQRARSAAKIFLNNNFRDDGYEAYGAEKIQNFNLPKGWEIYKVLLVGKLNTDNHIFLKVCIPFDEMLTALIAEMNQDCIEKVINIFNFRLDI